ncbi:MAG TPA: amidase [Bordetella sp.]|jgi:Asp-tRNA(Asn)/Glu-tRNA(Gln) amidotransferase A subunit family amidase|nr:amidase [Bordetella sp.]
MSNAVHSDIQSEGSRAHQALRAIAARDGELQAFVWQADPASLGAAASGVLAGMALGVKDVIDVAGMPTRCGALAMDAEPKSFDAACVAQLREAGAVPVGKTVTAEFASTVPGPTRNPHLASHTPGGSSSGSAAAVAAGMVDIALGTQTGGSVIRPAAFCGVVGYKPTFGRVHRGGMQVLCDSIDTIGWFTRTVAESAAVASVLMPGAQAGAARGRAPKVALLGCETLGSLTPAAQAALHDCAARLERQGATIVRPDLDADMRTLVDVHAKVMRYEMARGMLPVVRTRGHLVSESMRDAVRAGLAIDHAVYVSRQSLRAQLAARWLAELDQVDFIVAPSAPGEAPEGLASTGSSVFNRMWSLLGWPCIHLPTAFGDLGLPVGVQWIGRPDTDAALLLWAQALHPHVDTRAA